MSWALPSAYRSHIASMTSLSWACRQMSIISIRWNSFRDGAPKPNIMSTSWACLCHSVTVYPHGTNYQHQPGTKPKPPASSEHHQYQLDSLMVQSAGKRTRYVLNNQASSALVSRACLGRDAPTWRASSASAARAFAMAQPNSEHHQHQLDLPLPWHNHTTSIICVGSAGLWHRAAKLRASSASVGFSLPWCTQAPSIISISSGCLYHGLSDGEHCQNRLPRAQKNPEHHEHQLGLPLA